MLSITLRQLEYAVAVANHGGVSTAASAINISQPSLSVAIAKLEEDVGKSLFIRRKGEPFVPTSYGREFIENAQNLLSDAYALVAIDNNTSAPQSPISIGFFDDLAPLVLATIIKQLSAHHPNVVITTRVGGFEQIAEGLSSGRLDCAITYDLELDDTSHLSQLATLPVQALVQDNHRFAGLKSLNLADIVVEPLVLADQGHSVQHMISLFRQRGLNPKIAHRAASLETMRSLVGNGLGVGLSYTVPYSHFSYDGRKINSVKINDPGTDEPVVLATNPRNSPTALMKSVFATISRIEGLFSPHTTA